MRVFPGACAVALGVVLASLPPAYADEPTAEQVQARLVQSRVELNALYERAADAAERLNGAKYRLALARKREAREREAARETRAQVAEQSAAVAQMTVQQLQSGSGTAQLESLLSSSGPTELLERANAYANTAAALTSSIDELSARQTVQQASADRLAQAQDEQRAAVEREAAAQRVIRAAIAEAESTAASVEQERDRLLRELAARQDQALTTVEQRQDAIDAQVDAGLIQTEQDIPATPELPPTPDVVPDTGTTPDPSTPPGTEPTITPTPEAPTPPTPPATGGAAAAIAFARAHLGDPYKWGGAGPDRWDCSGLVMRAWEAAGIKLPHYAGAQYGHSQPVSMDAIQPGDLLFWGSKPTSAHHVAIYLGGDSYIHAPRPGRDVEIRTFAYWTKPKFAARPVA